MSDPRSRWLLAPGDKLICGNQEYTIAAEPIGYGGSSVIYPATASGSSRLYAIKECMPARISRFCRSGGVIRPADPADTAAAEMLSQYRKMLHRERTAGQIVSAHTNRVIGIWEDLSPTRILTGGEEYTHVEDGIFSLMDRMDKKGMSFQNLLKDIARRPSGEAPLRTGGLPRLETSCLLVLQTLAAVERVHSAGYLFGDVQDGNVFFTDCRLERGEIGNGNLLDFGSARILEADGKTEMITDSVIFTTKGFTPPEILYENNGLLRLGKPADLYGVGCLLLRCVLHSRLISLGRQSLDEDDGEDIGCTGAALTALNRILAKALAPNPDDRYPCADAMAQDVKILLSLVKQPENLLPRNLSAPEYFVPGSREREIRAVLQGLEGQELVFLHGVGGIGKTETAMAAARRVESVKGAFLIHYRGSMRDTLLSLPFSGDDEEQTAENRYSRNLRLLREEYQGAVLIIDNFDAEGKTLAQLQQEPAYQDLTGLMPGLMLIFTTRSPFPRPEWEIRPLEEGDLLKLLRHHLAGTAAEDKDLLALIREVQGHTLLLTLMAKLLHRSGQRLNAQMLLSSLRGGNLSELSGAIPSGQLKDGIRQYSQRDIQSHMTSLFRLTGLTEVQKQALGCASLMGDGGMNRMLFEDSLGEQGADTVWSLLDMGWLGCRDNTLTIHPVIREVCREVLQPREETCGDFLEALWARLEQAQQDPLLLEQCARLYETACQLPPDSSFFLTDCSYMIGSLRFGLGQYDIALQWFRQSIDLAEDNDDEGLDRLGLLYRSAGITLGALGRSLPALEALDTALDLLEEAEVESSQIAGTLTEIAREYYNALTDYNFASIKDWRETRKAIEACTRARELYAEDPERFHVELLLNDLLLSKIYLLMDNLSRAKEGIAQVLERYRDRPVEDFSLQFSLYRTYADILAEELSPEEREAHYLKLVELVEKWHYEDHPNGAVAYATVADFYLEENRWEDALFWAGKALDIRRKCFAEDSPKVKDVLRIQADGCYGLAHQLYLQGNLEQALIHIREAIAIRESMYHFSYGNWKSAVACYEAAMIHARLGQVVPAVNDMHRARKNGFPGFRDPFPMQLLWPHYVPKERSIYVYNSPEEEEALRPFMRKHFPPFQRLAAEGGWIVTRENRDDPRAMKAAVNRSPDATDLGYSPRRRSRGRYFDTFDAGSTPYGAPAQVEYHMEYALAKPGSPRRYMGIFYYLLLGGIASAEDYRTCKSLIEFDRRTGITLAWVWKVAANIRWFFRKWFGK